MITKSYQWVTKFWLILIILFCNGEWGECGEVRIWERTLVLDKEAGVTISWNITKTGGHDGGQQKTHQPNGQGWLDLEVFAPTSGYVGLGFSNNGAMRGSDIVILWVNNKGQGQLRDLHGTGNEQPEMDHQQDYELVEASETKDGTTVWFRRALDTCDEEQDFKILDETTRVIWAVGKNDPIIVGSERDSLGLISFDYHGVNGRGSKGVYFLDNPIKEPFPDDRGQNSSTVIHWDLAMSNNQINAEETTYFCKIVKFPHTDKKYHMIGYRPLITQANIKKVHHICMYECVVPQKQGGTAAKFEKHTTHEGGRCYTPNMPPEWAQHCMSFLVCWVIGSEGELVPKHLGLPLGEEHNGATYFMFEVHYHNPEGDTFTDSSGIRVFLDEPRQNEGHQLILHHRVTPFQYIPPRQKAFESYGICTGECTKAAFPPEGIKVVGFLHHAHLAGRKLRVRHVRNGVELPRITNDNAYDFNYQQSRILRKEVTVLPGDDLIVECEYDTMDRDKAVLGGLAATQEMCAAFLLYYPKIELSYCASQSEMYNFFRVVGIEDVTSKVFPALHLPYNPNLWPKEQQGFDPPDNARELESVGDGQSFHDVFDLMYIQRPEKFRNKTVSQYMANNLDWNDEKFTKDVNNGWRNGQHYAFCTGHGRKRIPIKNIIVKYPRIDKVYVDEAENLVCSSSPPKKGQESRLQSSGSSRFGFEILNVLTFTTLSLILYHICLRN